MAHSANIISKVKLPGSNIEYEIHDAQAIHSAEELGLSSALVYKGTKATKADLPTTGNKSGDVWHVTADDYEYVWNGSAWEEFGAPHDFVGTEDFDEHVEKYNNHVHETVTVTGSNSKSIVTGKVTVPSISTTAMYTKASAQKPSTGSDSVLGADTNFTVNIVPEFVDLEATRSKDVTVGGDSVKVLKSLGTPTTAKAITSLNTTSIKNPTSVTNVTFNPITNYSNATLSHVEISAEAPKLAEINSNTSVNASYISNKGTLPSWSAKVEGGILTFNFSEGALPTYSQVVASYIDNNDVSIEDCLTIADETILSVEIGAEVTASKVTTTDTIVATGTAKATADALTGLGTITTADVLQNVGVTQQPTFTLTQVDEGQGDVTTVTSIQDASLTVGTNDRVAAITSVDAPTITLNAANANTGMITGYSVSTTATDVDIKNGEAAAQIWEQKSGFTGKPSNPVG